MNYPSFWQHVAISAGPWLLLLAGQAMPAHAVATYHAAAETTLKIVSIAHAGGGVGLFLEGEALGDITTHATGSAIADGDQSAEVVAADPFDMVPGDRIEQTASSTGNALLPDGAESDVTTNGDLHINNVSAYDVTVFLELSYSLQAEATASDLSEWGFAVATVDLFSGIDDLVDIFFDRVYSDTDDGGGQFTGSGTIPFHITVPAGKAGWGAVPIVSPTKTRMPCLDPAVRRTGWDEVALGYTPGRGDSFLLGGVAWFSADGSDWKLIGRLDGGFSQLSTSALGPGGVVVFASEQVDIDEDYADSVIHAWFAPLSLLHA